MSVSKRRLPHRYELGQPLFVTFRLFGSLPAGREFPVESMTSGEAFLAMDRLLDNSRFEPLHLRRPEIARLVRDSILYCSGMDYDLHAWVIMPNHVHMLVTPCTNVSSFLRRLKGYSARQANRVLKRTGQAFWQDESYDHLVRSEQQFRSTERYILSNPVSAGLVHTIEAYPWSSAASRE